MGYDPVVGGGIVAYGNPFPTPLATLPAAAAAAISPLAIDRRRWSGKTGGANPNDCPTPAILSGGAINGAVNGTR